MTYRDLFLQIMFYGEFNQMPLIYWGEWAETTERWSEEGLPPATNRYHYFNALPFWGAVSPYSWDAMGKGDDIIRVGLFPPFEKVIYEQTDEFTVYQNLDGTIVRELRGKSNLPHNLGYKLVSATDWDDYKKRLQPDSGRLTPEIDARLNQLSDAGLPIGVQVCSLMGWLRNWMGVQNLVYKMHDEPDLIDDMVATLVDLSCWIISQVGSRVQIDLGSSWEDICGRAGPLISPRLFDRFIAPGYRKIRQKLEEYGAHLYAVDSDGDISALVGNWLDAGVNLLLPMEVGTFGGDVLNYRKKFGKQLRMMGNLDKRTLEISQTAVQIEIDRLMPLMKDGGFIVLPDHCITPGVPLKNFQWYADQIHKLRL